MGILVNVDLAPADRIPRRLFQCGESPKPGNTGNELRHAAIIRQDHLDRQRASVASDATGAAVSVLKWGPVVAIRSGACPFAAVHLRTRSACMPACSLLTTGWARSFGSPKIFTSNFPQLRTCRRVFTAICGVRSPTSGLLRGP